MTLPPCDQFQECTVFRIVGESVPGADISNETNFFEIGGTSLVAVNIMFALSAEYRTDLPIELMFEHPVMGDLSAAIRKHLSS